MNYRFLNGAYAIEVISGRLNGSAEQVEQRKSGYGNVSYVKKIGGRGVVSAYCQKFNIRKSMAFQGFEENPKIKIDKKILFNPDPYRYAVDDIFGFMLAKSEPITNEEYEQLPEEQKALYTKDGKKGWKQNVTKKRKSRFLMSPLVNVSNRRINNEWNICSTTGENMPFIVETYSGIFAGICNININDISKFVISDISTEFRDYSVEEVNDEKSLEISNEEKYRRIEVALRGLQYLSIEGNQSNYLTDTTPKIIILGEYSWGNNVFQGVIKDTGIDIEGLKETLYDNEVHRLSPIWIGVSNKIYDENYQGLKEKLKEAFKDYGYVKIGGVKESFDGYLQYLKETL